MTRHSFIQMSKLSNVKGRISYITSPARQENLYATYHTADAAFWTSLARENQQEFKRSGTEGTCIEAREFIIALPEKFTRYDPQRVLTKFTEEFQKRYNVECVSGLHHNKAKTNYHIHLIFSERRLLPEPVVKVATRNMFYDEVGKHVRTKKEITGEGGQIRPGCTVIKKGEVYESHMFSVKDARFKQEGFVAEVKEFYTGLINRYISDPEQQLKVFDPQSVYWRKHAHLIQPCSNATDGEAILVHGKDHLHILADGLIDDKLVFVIQRFLVAIGRECPDELTVLLLDLQAGSDFHGYILAVGVVDEVFERDNKGIRLRIAGQAVVSVVDRDKADAELREYLFQIPTAVDVVSRKAAEVFDHDAVNRAFADCVFELFEVWTIEGNTAITIVNERLTDNFQIVMPCNVVLANGSLACNGVAFNFVPVFTGQAAVNRRPVNFSGHKNNLRFLFGVIHQIRKTKASASCMRKTR